MLHLKPLKSICRQILFLMTQQNKKQIKYIQNCLNSLPQEYTSTDTTKLTLFYFTISSLDILDSLDILNKPSIVEYILKYKEEHLASTYLKLLILIILNEFKIISELRESILQNLKKLQSFDNSFVPFEGSLESDLRFVYCSVAISYILNDFSSLNIKSVILFIKDCVCYDGGLSQGKFLESHGGSTYCGVASIYLLEKYFTRNKGEFSRVCQDLGFDLMLFKKRCLEWCLKRQIKGFQGRCGKAEDCCYSFWIGGSLQLLGGLEFVDENKLFEFIGECEMFGGYGKEKGDLPGILLLINF